MVKYRELLLPTLHASTFQRTYLLQIQEHKISTKFDLNSFFPPMRGFRTGNLRKLLIFKNVQILTQEALQNILVCQYSRYCLSIGADRWNTLDGVCMLSKTHNIFQREKSIYPAGCIANVEESLKIQRNNKDFFHKETKSKCN